MRWLSWLAGAAAMVAFTAHLPAAPAGQESAAPAPAADSAATGATLYERYCAACHGANLEPAESVFDLRDLAPSDKQRFMNSVARGKSSMPGWGALLTPQQIETLWDLVMSKKAAPASAAAAPAGAVAATAAPAAPSQACPCGGDAKLLVDSAGNPVWIASDELLSHAVSAPPATPAAANATTGRVTVDVLVDSQGRVKCARAAPGSVAPPPAALEAIGKWTFRAFAAAGQPVAVFAHLQLTVETK
jgi:mono/diheme cytochrome c family protein